MNIAMLIPRFIPKWLGGAEIAVYNIASQLAKNGHEVHVVTLWGSGLPGESFEQGFFIHRLKLPKIKFVGIVIFWFRILLTLNKIAPDVIHVHSIIIAMPAFLARRLLKIPYIVQGHGFDVYFPWRFKKIIAKIVFKNAKAMIALTENMKNEMIKIYDREILVIPNGIDIEKFEYLPTKQAVREKLGLDDDNRVIIFVGRLCEVKGVKYLVQAMDIIVREEKNARLMLIGKGEEGGYLRSLVAEFLLEKYVTFIEEVPNEQIPEYLTAADIFVLPSLSEGFPLVSLEGMACGLPIIASKVGGLPEIIEDGVNGFLVKPAAPMEIVEKILRLLREDDLRRIISENNKKKARNYDWISIVQEIEKVYRHNLEGKKWGG